MFGVLQKENEMVYFPINVRLLTPEEKKQREDSIPKFMCCLCGTKEEKQKYGFRAGSFRANDPVCRACVGHWAVKASGHVYQRQEYANLRQLSAAVNQLSWEVKNGRYR
jgi:hypothetical protein